MSRSQRPRGWRIDRIPGKPVRRTPEGGYVLPLWLLQDGEHRADLELPLSPAEADALRAELAGARNEGPQFPAEAFG